LEQFLDFFHVLFSVGASGIAFGGRKTHLALTVRIIPSVSSDAELIWRDRCIAANKIKGEKVEQIR